MNTFRTLLMMLMMAALATTTAQAKTQQELRAEWKDVYEQTMRDPGNLDLTLRCSEIAVELGDYEAAIPPLERILMKNPGLGKVQLELGTLYNLLGSKAMAKQYFEQAATSKNPVVADEARANLKNL